jgi:hypothetical protein
MTKKLSWERILAQYDQQWVELIDYDWPDEEPFPRAGTVRVHAASRKEFDRLINVNPPPDSAIVFVGKRKLSSDILWSANAHQWKISTRI